MMAVQVVFANISQEFEPAKRPKTFCLKFIVETLALAFEKPGLKQSSLVIGRSLPVAKNPFRYQ